MSMMMIATSAILNDTKNCKTKVTYFLRENVSGSWKRPAKPVWALIRKKKQNRLQEVRDGSLRVQGGQVLELNVA